jgi:hypothetical protein
MFKKILIGVIGSILIFSIAVFALTPEEAKASAGKQTTEKKLGVRDHSSEIMSNGINNEHGSGKVTTATNASSGGKKSGTPGKATTKRTHNMDGVKNGNRHHDGGMDHDRDRDMMHNHMGGGQGMGYGTGMNRGSHMGYGSGPGMGQGSGMGPGMGGWHR